MFIFVDEKFEGNLQFFTVMQKILMRTWDTSCAAIEIQVWLIIEFADLGIADFINQRAMTHGHDATTTSM